MDSNKFSALSETDFPDKDSTADKGTVAQSEESSAEEKESRFRNFLFIPGILILILLATLLVLKFIQKQTKEKVFYYESIAGIRQDEPDFSLSIPDREIGHADSALVNVNTADVSDLTRLPGIGQKRAEAIVEYRLENGPFTSPTDLLNVKGIGEKTVEAIAPLICFFEEE